MALRRTRHYPAVSAPAYTAVFIITIFTMGVDIYLEWYYALVFPIVTLLAATWFRFHSISPNVKDMEYWEGEN